MPTPPSTPLRPGSSSQGRPILGSQEEIKKGKVFRLRVGPNYKRNKKKDACTKPPLYDTICCDLFITEKKMLNIGRFIQLPSLPSDRRVVNGIPPYFILTLMFPLEKPSMFSKKKDGKTMTLVLYLVLTEHAHTMLQEENLHSAADPEHRLLHRFITEDGILNERFKLIAGLMNAAQVIKSTMLIQLINKYNFKPVLTRPQHFFHRGGDTYFECDVDIHDFNYLSRTSWYSLKEAISDGLVEGAAVIEGHSDDELPEALLCKTVIRNVAETNAVTMHSSDFSEVQHMPEDFYITDIFPEFASGKATGSDVEEIDFAEKPFIGFSHEAAVVDVDSDGSSDGDGNDDDADAFQEALSYHESDRPEGTNVEVSHRPDASHVARSHHRVAATPAQVDVVVDHPRPRLDPAFERRNFAASPLSANHSGGYRLDEIIEVADNFNMTANTSLALSSVSFAESHDACAPPSQFSADGAEEVRTLSPIDPDAVVPSSNRQFLSSPSSSLPASPLARSVLAKETTTGMNSSHATNALTSLNHNADSDSRGQISARPVTNVPIVGGTLPSPQLGLSPLPFSQPQRPSIRTRKERERLRKQRREAMLRGGLSSEPSSPSLYYPSTSPNPNPNPNRNSSSSSSSSNTDAAQTLPLPPVVYIHGTMHLSDDEAYQLTTTLHSCHSSPSMTPMARSPMQHRPPLSPLASQGQSAATYHSNNHSNTTTNSNSVKRSSPFTSSFRERRVQSQPHGDVLSPNNSSPTCSSFDARKRSASMYKDELAHNEPHEHTVAGPQGDDDSSSEIVHSGDEDDEFYDCVSTL